MIGAGSVVVSNVLDYSLTFGVPAKQVGWVGKLGVKLIFNSKGEWECPISHEIYKIS